MKKVLVLFVCLLALASCGKDNGAAESLKGKNIRMVIGSSSTSGDTYMVSELVARYLGQQLEANVKVDPVGAARALETIRTVRADGTTIMLFHDMTYLGVLFGSLDEKYAMENMIVGPIAVQNSGSAWAAGKNRPYNDLVELAEYLKANPTEQVRFALEAGGVSHVGFVVYYKWVADTYGEDVANRIRVILGGSTGDKLQLLWDGNADVIYSDYASFYDYTQTDDEKIALKYVGLFDNLQAIDVPSYADLGITLEGNEYRFSKEYLLFLPKSLPEHLQEEIDSAMAAVGENEDFIADLAKLQYNSQYMSISDSTAWFTQKREEIAPVIATSPDLDSLVYTE